MKKNEKVNLINSLMEASLKARRFYLRKDVIERAKLLLTEDKETMYIYNLLKLGKRIWIIMHAMGEEEGSKLIQEAVDSLLKELEKDKSWTKTAKENIEYFMDLNNFDIRITSSLII